MWHNQHFLFSGYLLFVYFAWLSKKKHKFTTVGGWWGNEQQTNIKDNFWHKRLLRVFSPSAYYICLPTLAFGSCWLFSHSARIHRNSATRSGNFIFVLTLYLPAIRLGLTFCPSSQTNQPHTFTSSPFFYPPKVRYVIYVRIYIVDCTEACAIIQAARGTRFQPGLWLVLRFGFFWLGYGRSGPLVQRMSIKVEHSQLSDPVDILVISKAKGQNNKSLRITTVVRVVDCKIKCRLFEWLMTISTCACVGTRDFIRELPLVEHVDYYNTRRTNVP